jgi:hypothetical protein
MTKRNRFITVLVAMVVAVMLLVAFAPVALADQYLWTKTVPAGTEWVVGETTHLSVLTVEPGASVKAPAGYSISMTVNGVETGQALVSTNSVDLAFVPGTYAGVIVLTVAVATPFDYAPAGPPGTPHVVFPFRQALYVDAAGVQANKSVLPAVVGGTVTNAWAKGVSIASTGQSFNGVYVGGGTFKLDKVNIDFSGNARSDFAGYGAALEASGVGTTLVVDGANIKTKGVARSAVVATNGSNVVVKNSHIETYNGVLPADYIPTIDTGIMRSVPWMLSLSGNVRSTNLLGTDTKAAYINSYIASEGWGVLSTDGCTTPKLTAINSTIAILGEDGYGSYGIGDATERFLGCTFDVGTYATISRGSFLFYGDSDAATVAQLNTDLGLGLSAAELAALPVKQTIVNSDRFGIMWHGGGTLDVSGGTIFNTKETTFLDKGQTIAVTVDGSKGAKLLPGNGVIMQLMDDDDPGPVFPAMTNTGVYNEPADPPALDASHNNYAAGPMDAVATFSSIALKGNFYNSYRGGMGPAGPFPGAPMVSNSKNLALTFNNVKVTGVITASAAKHAISTITAADYKYLGEVTNTPGAAINNGVIVKLAKGSLWTITGTSYLTSLTIEQGSKLTAAKGFNVSMTVNGLGKPIRTGTYAGAIVLKVTPKTVH